MYAQVVRLAIPQHRTSKRQTTQQQQQKNWGERHLAFVPTAAKFRRPITASGQVVGFTFRQSQPSLYLSLFLLPFFPIKKKTHFSKEQQINEFDILDNILTK